MKLRFKMDRFANIGYLCGVVYVRVEHVTDYAKGQHTNYIHQCLILDGQHCQEAETKQK